MIKSQRPQSSLLATFFDWAFWKPVNSLFFANSVA